MTTGRVQTTPEKHKDKKIFPVFLGNFEIDNGREPNKHSRHVGWAVLIVCYCICRINLVEKIQKLGAAGYTFIPGYIIMARGPGFGHPCSTALNTAVILKPDLLNL